MSRREQGLPASGSEDRISGDDEKPTVVDVDKAPAPSSNGADDEFPAASPADPSALGPTLSQTRPLSLADVQPVDVRIRSLGVDVDTSTSWLKPVTWGPLAAERLRPTPSSKPLLQDVSASLRPGSLTAILGGSGSGKTTLLNTLAERTSSAHLSCTGSVTFNGRPGVHGVRSAYVMQQDILLESLTVRETLQYSAQLRLPSGTAEEDRLRVVEEVVLELGLKECADTRIGSSLHKGCSGGEKRRTSIGVQMLANPSVLFLDEPTTGLDSTSAFQLVRTLKGLSKRGRTVVTTIHQPRSEIWALFDNVIVLGKGRPVYSGPMDGCAPWFDSRGFPLPPFVNPAEFFIDVAAVDTRSPELEAETVERVQSLQRAWRDRAAALFPDQEPAETKAAARADEKTPPPPTTQQAPFLRQLRVLTSRTFKTTYRDPLGMSAALMEAVLMSIVTGYMFFDLARDRSGIRSREGALYTVSGLQGYLVLVFEVFRLTIDIPTFDREHGEGCVGALPYVLSRRLARFLTEDVPVPLVFSSIYYFMTGLERTAQHFFVFFAITLLNHYIAVTCAMACVAAVRHFAGASLIANLAYTLQSMACGMFVQANSMPVYVRWLKYITYTYYVFSAYCGNEFQDNFYDCPYEGGRSNPACGPYAGEYVMASLGFPAGWVARPIIVLMAFVVSFFLLSVVGLEFFKAEMVVARPRVADTDLSAGKEKMKARSIEPLSAIDVGLDRFSLGLERRSWLGRTSSEKTILHPVTATFRAGVLNVIMGPSGSGKTSLLNCMALRLRNTPGTRYRPSGRLTFNGTAPSRSVIRSVCSYVCQDDDALLPSLTVRETLRFAAGLRLPPSMGTEEKNRRAEEVLLKMGLKDCADTLVGNDLVKGISGGEKRRVSIAVQVLTDPRVLLLDEPTSGLDAFTASSIMEVLRGLAQEGRTLVVTIHQARSDLFRHFGSVLLLARGGHTAYAGAAADMRAYFGDLGFPCPQQSNPADFALDLVAVDLQEEGREARSRETVSRLVDGWRERSERLSAAMAMEEGAGSGADGSGGSGENDPNSMATPAQLRTLIRRQTPLYVAMPLLVRRALVNTRRQPDQVLARLGQVLGLALVMALFFAPLPNDSVAGVQNRMGFIQQLGSLYFVGMLQNVAVYPAERDVFYREHDDGVYGVEAFLGTYSLLEFPFEVASCLLFGVLSTFAIRLPWTVEVFFACTFACFGIVSCGESVGIVFNTFFSAHAGFAMNLTNVVLSIANVMTGILSTDMPAPFKALNYLSPIRYATRALAPYALGPVTFTCADEDRVPAELGGGCPVETGEDVLRLYNFGDLGQGPANVAALAGCVVAYRLVAWGVLRAARGRWGEKFGELKGGGRG